MKRVIGALVVGMSLLAVGCSDGRIKNVDDGEVVIAEAPTGEGERGEEIGSTQQALDMVELRMRAEGTESYASLMLVPNDVKVFADGVQIEVKPTFRMVNLANTAHAEQIATFMMPRGVKNIAFKVDLGAGGGFDTASTSGYIDTRNSVLSFEMSAAELDRMKRAVVIVDADRSFIPRDETTLVMVPNFRVD